MTAQTYEAWRISYQSSEQAARAAFARVQELEKENEVLRMSASDKVLGRDVGLSAYEVVSESFMRIERICMKHGYRYQDVLPQWIDSVLTKAQRTPLSDERMDGIA